MGLFSLITLAVGALVVIVLVATFDHAAIASSVAASGWGLAVICFYRVVPVACEAKGWAQLIPGEYRPRYALLLLYRWISKAINTLLPAMQVGGDLVRVRLLVRGGVNIEPAGASVLVDVTIWLAAQIIFILLGTGVFVTLRPGGGMVAQILSSLAIGTGLIAVFFFAQRRGLLRVCAILVRRVVGEGSALRLVTVLQSMDRSVAELYRSTLDMAAAAVWHLLAWLLRTGDTWLTMYFMGAPIGLREAIVLESLSIAVRSAAFMVPAGVGAQEAAIVAVGMQLGLSPELALAMALVKRLQEVVVFVPGLTTWFLVERDSWNKAVQRLAKWRSRSGAPSPP